MAHSFLSAVNKQINNNLNEKDIEGRKDAGSGVWLSLLLPIGIILGEIKHKTSQNYQSASCISCGLLLHSILVMVNAYYQNSTEFANILLSSTLSTLLLYFYTHEGLIVSIMFGFLSIFIYHKLLLPVMKLFPKSFSYGECTVACQGFVLFIFCSIIRETQPQMNCFVISTTMLQFGNICVIVIAACAYYYRMKSKPMQFYSLVCFIIVFVLLPSLHFAIGQNALLWILNLLSKDKDTMKMVVFWVVCSLIGALAVVTQIKNETKASTSIRKIFHGLIIIVFMPGLILNPCLIYLSSGVVFAIFIALDMLRILKMPPLGDTLQSGFAKFADEKDEGPIALTPIYLLVGCSLPLWIHPNLDKSDLLPLLAGLLSVGIGDSAASICGTFVGKNKWPGSKKTKEGSAACFLSQLFVVILLIHIGYVPRTNLIKPTFAIATSSFVEAKTDQVDNIALPLIILSPRKVILSFLAAWNIQQNEHSTTLTKTQKQHNNG